MSWAAETNIKGPPGGISEAPTDGKTYGRNNAAWSEVTGGSGGGIPEAPNDGKVYARKSTAWTDIVGTASAGMDTFGEVQDYITSNIMPAIGNKADTFSPTLTGDPKAPTPATADNDTSIATTAFVKAQNYLTAVPATYAPLANPVFTGDPKAPTPTAGDNDTSIATTAFVTTAVAAGGGGGAAVVSVNTVLITTSQTYTPNAKLLFADVEVRGSGGSGGGCYANAANNCAVGAGGGQGSLSKSTLSAATIGVSQAVTIGNAGAAQGSGAVSGVAGADCSLGTLVIGKGGQGGTYSNSATQNGMGGAGGVAGTGQFNEPGFAGGSGSTAVSTAIALISGSGGGAGGGPGIANNANGPSATGYGAGGAGGCYNGSAAGGNAAGGAGSKGYVLIKEYLKA